MKPTAYIMEPIGIVRSKLTSRAEAPRQGSEDAPDAWLEVSSKFTEGLEGIAVGHEIILITWFHEARRDILKLHPRRDEKMPLTGVFTTRSPDRPNPLGLHRVTVFEISGNKLRIGPMEAINGTPVVDIKPVLAQSADS